MVEGSCPFRRRSEELAADVRLLGDGSPELYPESLIVRAAQKEKRYFTFEEDTGISKA